MTMISDYQGLTKDELVLAVAEDLFSSMRILRQQLNGMERLIMIDLDQVLTEVQSQSSMIAELSTAVATLSKHISDHSDGTSVAPVVQEKIDSLMSSAAANKTALADTMKVAIAAIQAVEALKTAPAKDGNLA